VVVDSYDLAAVERALRAALDCGAPAVVVAERDCVLLPEVRRAWQALQLDTQRCNGCGLCLQLGCPALGASDVKAQGTGRAIAQIDPLLCTGCEVCAQVCVRDAIARRAPVGV
jgi:indolepyruvate ferredoxin oxidoreductase alpha subunit